MGCAVQQHPFDGVHAVAWMHTGVVVEAVMGVVVTVSHPPLLVHTVVVVGTVVEV